MNYFTFEVIYNFQFLLKYFFINNLLFNNCISIDLYIYVLYLDGLLYIAYIILFIV